MWDQQWDFCCHAITPHEIFCRSFLAQEGVLFPLDLNSIVFEKKVTKQKDSRPVEVRQKIKGNEARFSKVRCFPTWLPDDAQNLDIYEDEVGEGIIVI